MRPYPLVATFASLATAATFALLALHSPYAIGAVGAVAFLLAPAVNALVFATIADEAPDALQGRATSAAIQLGNLGAPIGPILAGALLGALGAVHAIAVYGCVMLGLAAVALLSRDRLTRD
jgi:predicted MFS family arabinose efflux permease